MNYVISVFYCFGAHRDLHSFPTRRSSDLFSVSRNEQRTRFAIRQVDPVRQWKLSPMDLASLEDRKSTRLNSSHLGISYAVFCLKKKNTSEVLNAWCYCCSCYSWSWWCRQD